VRLVYICAPFRGPTEWARAENVRNAERFALSVWRCGAVAISPQANSSRFDGQMPDQVFLDGYLELLRRCDALLVCGPESAGMAAEVALAREIALPIFYTVEELSDWIRREERGPLFEGVA
jgi:hypothetical protein